MGHQNKHSTYKGFTIVELLIVVVVIAILAAITLVAYNGIQDRAKTAKINTDMANFEKAILAARNAKGSVALRFVTESVGSGGSCWSKATGTELAELPSSDGCWVNYNAALAKISDASGINIRNLVDPWGRPYYMDENEGEGAVPATGCNPDRIGYYSRPITTGQTMTVSMQIDRIQPGCV